MTRVLFAAMFAITAASGPASARDEVVRVTLEDVLALPDAQGKIDGSVRFFLAGQTMPAVVKKFGSDVANKKTNGVGKDDQFGCKYVVLSALIAFQQKAKQQGANAVVDIVSYYKKNEVRNAHTIECHAGNILIGAALKGSYARIAS